MTFITPLVLQMYHQSY